MKHLIIIALITFLYPIVTRAQLNSKKIQLIIDADTANEVDDLFAIVRAINEPKFNLLGISSAQFHTSPLASDSSVFESQQLNEKILEILKRDDIALPLGSNNPLTDTETAVESEAADYIINKAHEIEQGQKLYVVILGSCTNLASAILKDSTIIPKIKAFYIGFWHDPNKNTYNKNEFNSNNDPFAVEVLLNSSALDLSIMTATTSQHLVFNKNIVNQHLKDKGGIADFLVNRWETYNRWWTDKDPEKYSWIMWDLTIIEALILPKLTEKATFITPEGNTQRPITIYTSINTKEMEADFWKNFQENYRN